MLEKVYGHFKTSTFDYSKARLDASRLSCP